MGFHDIMRGHLDNSIRSVLFEQQFYNNLWDNYKLQRKIDINRQIKTIEKKLKIQCSMIWNRKLSQKLS